MNAERIKLCQKLLDAMHAANRLKPGSCNKTDIILGLSLLLDAAREMDRNIVKITVNSFEVKR